MENVQVSIVKQASTELKELTTLFTNWGKSLYEGEVSEEKSSFERGLRTYNNMEVIGRVSYDKGETICDDFSLYKFAQKVMEK